MIPPISIHLFFCLYCCYLLCLSPMLCCYHNVDNDNKRICICNKNKRVFLRSFKSVSSVSNIWETSHVWPCKRVQCWFNRHLLVLMFGQQLPFCGHCLYCHKGVNVNIWSKLQLQGGHIDQKLRYTYNSVIHLRLGITCVNNADVTHTSNI